jgi:hypothetical protein
MKPAIAAAKVQAGFPASHPYWAGLLLGVATIPVLLALPQPVAQRWAALLLAVIGSAYVGFAARDGRLSANLIELAGAVAFAAIGLAGLQFNPLLIAGGYVGHGFWDLLHHRHGPYAHTPDWYIPFCVLYDWMVGRFLLVWWW